MLLPKLHQVIVEQQRAIDVVPRQSQGFLISTIRSVSVMRDNIVQALAISCEIQGTVAPRRPRRWLVEIGPKTAAISN